MLWRQEHVYSCIFNSTLLTMAVCTQDLDSAVLYAFLRFRGKATALKHEKKVPVKHWNLATYGFGYTCSLHLSCQDCPGSTAQFRIFEQAWERGCSERCRVFFNTCTYSQLIVISNYMEAAASLWLGKASCLASLRPFTITHKLVPPLPAFLVWCKSKGVV